MGTGLHRECADKRYLGHTYLMHTQQLDRIKLHVNISKKRKSEALYIDFLIMRNTAMENLCKAYCAVETPNQRN